MRHIKKKRLVRMLRPMLPNVAAGKTVDRFGVEKILPRRDLGVVQSQRVRIVKTPRAVDCPEKTVKTPLQRPVVLRAFRRGKATDMPLASLISAIAGSL